MDIKEYVDIREHSTFKVGGQFRYFIELHDVEMILSISAFAIKHEMPVKVIGSGSNIVFPDGVLECIVIKNEIEGFDIIREDDDTIDIKIGAGENWDSLVARTVGMGLSGIEALSSIPGTVGATPVQNVGAYGQEVKDTIVSVEVFDMKEVKIRSLSNNDCKFSYRDSIFKNEAQGLYIITSVTFRLSKGKASIPNYAGVQSYFQEKGILNPTLLQIREAIIDIRRTKLPDPKEIANVGSFFKNPIISKDVADSLKIKYPIMSIFPIGEDKAKISAGWLIEHAGLKGKDFGPISVYQNNALVLVNNGTADRKDVIEVKNKIIQTVLDAFGILLETEPEFV